MLFRSYCGVCCPYSFCSCSCSSKAAVVTLVHLDKLSRSSFVEAHFYFSLTPYSILQFYFSQCLGYTLYISGFSVCRVHICIYSVGCTHIQTACALLTPHPHSPLLTRSNIPYQLISGNNNLPLIPAKPKCQLSKKTLRRARTSLPALSYCLPHNQPASTSSSVLPSCLSYNQRASPLSYPTACHITSQPAPSPTLLPVK